MAGAGSTARVDGCIIKDRVDIEANLPDLGTVGTGAEARATSGNSATCETCAKDRSGEWQILTTEGSIQKARHPADVRGHDLEQDTETEAYTSESLTMWLRQVQQRRGEGQEKALSCLTLTKSERKAPCEPRRGWRTLRRMQWKEVPT